MATNAAIVSACRQQNNESMFPHFYLLPLYACPFEDGMWNSFEAWYLTSEIIYPKKG